MFLKPSSLVLLAPAAILLTASAALPPRAAQSPIDSRHRLSADFGKLPLAFEADRSGARFRARGSGYDLQVGRTGADLALRPGTATPATPARLRLQLVGANAHAALHGYEKLPGRVNYLIGNDPAKWRRNVETFARVRAADVYPKVDACYYGNQRELEYDLVVRPGGDPASVRLSFAGSRERAVPRIDAAGDLVLTLPGGEARQHRPNVYQTVQGVRRPVEARYRLLAAAGRTPVIGLSVAAYDRSRPLVIDPVLSYSTYLGGSGNDKGLAIAVDAGGNTYVAGSTTSTDFPVSNALQGTAGANSPRGDAFISKLDPTGSSLVYSTYLGGSGSDVALGLAVDSNSSPYLVGKTDSPNFPTSHPIQATLRGETDAFVTKLDPSGASLTYSTYLGGSSTDVGIAIAVDSVGQASIVGRTASTNFPTSAALQPQPGSGSLFDDAFVARLSADGQSLLFSTYLGGNRQEMLGDEGGVAVDSDGNTYVAGSTTSTDFPTTAGAFDRQAGGNGMADGFIAKLSSTGSTLAYSTYLGGSGTDQITGIAIDAGGNAYVGGVTNSTDFPTVSALQATFGGGDTDGFVSKLSADGSTLAYSTYLGGSSSDAVRGITADSAGHAFVAGETFSANFPIAHPLQPWGSSYDAFVARLNTAGNALEFSSFLGGSLLDTGAAIAVDTSGSMYLTGSTQSPDFPTVLPLNMPSAGAGGDAFVAKISDGSGPPVFPSNLHAISVCDTALTLAWNDNSDNEKTFDIERRTGVGAYRLIASVIANTTSYSDSGLLPNTTYTYRVRASNDDGSSLNSNEFSATTLANAVLPPSGFGATAQSPTTVQLSWTDTSGGTATFQIERSTDSGATFAPLSPVAAGVTSFLDTTANANTAYVYRIRAGLNGCSSAYSPNVSVTTPPQPIPAPSGLTLRAVSDDTIALTWVDNSTGEDGFHIERKVGNDPYAVIASTAANTTSYTDTGLSANGTYYYRVEAFLGNSVSDPSAEAHATTLPLPIGVLKVVKSVNFGKTSVGGPITKLLTITNASRNQRMRVSVGPVGPGTSPFSIVSGSGSTELLVGGSTTVKLKFLPTARGTAKGSLSIASTDPHHASVTVHLIGSAK